MTDSENQEFFEQVKGKKIYWSMWPDTSKYFIPESRKDTKLEGVTGSDSYDSYRTPWWIEEGFNNNNSESEAHWIFFEKDEIIKQVICTCDMMETIMIIGCQCDGN